MLQHCAAALQRSAESDSIALPFVNAVGNRAPDNMQTALYGCLGADRTRWQIVSVKEELQTIIRTWMYACLGVRWDSVATSLSYAARGMDTFQRGRLRDVIATFRAWH